MQKCALTVSLNINPTAWSPLLPFPSPSPQVDFRIEIWGVAGVRWVVTPHSQDVCQVVSSGLPSTTPSNTELREDKNKSGESEGGVGAEWSRKQGHG